MDVLIIGSIAKTYNNRNSFNSKGFLLSLLGSHRGDIDVVGTKESVQKFGEYLALLRGPRRLFVFKEETKRGNAYFLENAILETEEAEKNSLSAEILMFITAIANKVCQVNGVNVWVARSEFLLLLKYSHKYLKNNPYFNKTRVDLSSLDSISELTIFEHYDNWAPVVSQWAIKRIKETYSYEMPKLNVGKKEFFKPSDNIYKYDHDSIHRAVAIRNRPAYLEYQKADSEVMTSRELFFKCSKEVRLFGVVEESCVLALERSVIPFNTPKEFAFRFALEKVCTSITGGWFREYAYGVFDEALAYGLEYPYVEKFETALRDGLILPFEEKNNDQD